MDEIENINYDNINENNINDAFDDLKENLKKRNRYYYLKRIEGRIKNFTSGTKYDSEIIKFLTNKKKFEQTDLFKKYM